MSSILAGAEAVQSPQQEGDLGAIEPLFDVPHACGVPAKMQAPCRRQIRVLFHTGTDWAHVAERSNGPLPPEGGVLTTAGTQSSERERERDRERAASDDAAARGWGTGGARAGSPRDGPGRPLPARLPRGARPRAGSQTAPSPAVRPRQTACR